MSNEPVPVNLWFEEISHARDHQAQVDQARVEARRQLRLAVLDAHQRGGIGVSALARHLSVTRQSVYEILEAARKDFPDRPRS